MPIPLLRSILLPRHFALHVPAASLCALNNDYPTEAIAEYVYACMKATARAHRSSRNAPVHRYRGFALTYDRYVEAGTF